MQQSLEESPPSIPQPVFPEAFPRHHPSAPHPAASVQATPMSSCAAVTWTLRTRYSWTTMVCGSKASLISGCQTVLGLEDVMNVTPNRGHQGGELVVVHGQCGLPPPD